MAISSGLEFFKRIWRMLPKPVRAAVKRFRDTPHNVFNRYIWGMRRALSPLLPIRCWVHTWEGAHYYLSSDPADDYILDGVLVKQREVYFPPELSNAVEPLILDIGAHHGIVAVEMLRRNPGARLIAVEPNPAAVQLLKKNITANSVDNRAEIMAVAIGSANGTACLRFSKEGSWGDSTFIGGNEQSYGTEYIEVPSVTVSTLLCKRTPDIIKCNAEGAEFEFFNQLFSLTCRPRLVIIMTHSRHGESEALLDRFRQEGYEVRQVGDNPEHFHCRLLLQPEHA